MFYDKTNMDNSIYMESYSLITKSIGELEESMSWPKWRAKKVLDYIIIQEVVEQSSTNKIAKLLS